MKRLLLIYLCCFFAHHANAQAPVPKALPTGAIYGKVPDTLLHVTQLKEVGITAEKPGISLKLDKKVFEVGKDILSQSGSAQDILNGVPSVAVSPDGSISLRGNTNVLILINGRRTGLTQNNALDQVPANMIERVEVITNPSSRYDAAGSAGIINLILKKNKKAGFNGQVKVMAGSPGETRVNPSLNFKSNKINLFSTLGIRLSDYNGFYTTDQVTLDNGQSNFLSNVQKERRHDDAKLVYLGADYFIDSSNTITAAYFKNATHDHDRTTLNYLYSNENGNDSSLVRHGESWEKRDYNQVEFNYTRIFKQPRKKFTVDLQYDFWNSDKTWQLNTQKLTPVVVSLSAIRTSSIGASKDFEIQSDFEQPLSKQAILELGVKLENRKVTSDFKAEEAQDQKWEILDNIDNKLQYNELISSAYAQLNNKGKKLSYLLGLRTEQTKISIEDRVGIYKNKKNYGRFFPTLNLSYQFKEGVTTQFSYSKRINRPSLWMLYPFNELTDFNSQFIGNPELDPSYADVYELGFLRNWGAFTFNPSVYYQNNKHFIQTYTYQGNAGIFYSMPINLDRETRQGIELSLLYNPFKWLQANGEMNLYSFRQTGMYKTQNFNFNGHALTGRVSIQAKLPAKFSVQARYNYAGPQSSAQRYTYAVQYVDLGISKTLLKDKATITAEGTNIFNSRKTRTRTTGENYVFNDLNNPNAARYRFTFTYRFNLKDGQAIRQAKSGNRN